MSPPATDDPFALFGLPRRFDIDPVALRTAHRRLAAASHPDRAGGGAAAAEAARASAALNEAFRAIAEPLARGETLLRLEGAAAGSEEMPAEFLQEMMEWREAIEEAIASSDAARLEEMAREAERRRDDLLQSVGGAFAEVAGAPGPERPSSLRTARQRLNALRYIERVLARLSPSGA